MQNLALSEVDFDKFQRFCREKGFDLSYFGSEVSGSREQIERHQFDSPKVIKLRKSRFGFAGIQYDVAEWQQANWRRTLPKLRDEFFEKIKEANQMNGPGFPAI